MKKEKIISDYTKQLESENEELRERLAQTEKRLEGSEEWKPSWIKGTGNVSYIFVNKHVILAEVRKDIIYFKPKFYVATMLSYDLVSFHTAEKCKDFIDENIKGISWKL